MQANVVKNIQGVDAITNREQVELAKVEDLFVNDKRVLIVRGNDTSQTVGQIFREFANRKDSTGHRFQFSRKPRGITEIDPVWTKPVRVTPPRMENYIKEWFTLAELVSTTALGEILVLTNKIPPHAIPLWVQSRYAARFADLLEVVD